MASSTSSTSSSSNSYLSGIRLSGSSLLSGLDTENIVKQMASGTKARINSQQQKLDLLSWKQESYRSVISKITKFKDTYFNSLTPSSNIGSNTLMGKSKAVSSNSAVTVSAGANATETTYSISSIQSLASSAKVDSNFGTGSLSNGVRLDFSSAVSGTTYNIKLTLDGAAKNISFTAGADKAATAANFEAAVQSAFGTNFSMSGDSLIYTAGDSIAHSFQITASTLSSLSSAQKTAGLAAVGLPNGASSKVSTGAKLSEINFSTPLVGGSYSFEINGQSFTFDSSATIKEIINTVNSNTSANVTMSFDTLSQKFSIKSNDDGASSSISMKQTSGNLLTALFGSQFVEGNSLGSAALMSKSITGTAVTNTDFTALKNSQIEITVNGVTKKIGLWAYDSSGEKYDYTDTTSNGVTTTGAAKAAASLNTELAKAFGSSAPTFSYDSATGKITLKASGSSDIISISAISGDSASSALVSRLGFTSGATNQLNSSSKLSDLMGSNFKAGTFTVGSSTVTVDSSTTLGDIAAALGSEGTVDYTRGIITANAQITASDSDSQSLVAALFGGSNDYNSVHNYAGTLSGAPSANTVTDTGENAVLTINGTTITNATNTITINGTTINIGGLTTKADGSVDLSAGPITVTTSRDTSAAKDTVIKFIDAYNTLIGDLYKEINTKRPTDDGTLSGSKYEPLTEEQKEQMTEDQIKAWEEKGKTGLLYNDSTISNFLSKLRTAMSTRTSDNFSLTDMGITVSTTLSDNGKLIISDETKFNEAFEKYADKIQELFTNTDKGLAKKVSDVIDGAVSTSSVKGYGSLVRIAGVANTRSASDNQITTQISQYSKTISTLKQRYSSELERYWNKFTRLETMMAKYLSYSSMFTSSTS
jgi:flagellar capping protein FliD